MESPVTPLLISKIGATPTNVDASPEFLRRRITAYEGVLLVHTADFGVTLFSPIANVVAANKGWSARETTLVVGSTLFAFTAGALASKWLKSFGTVETIVVAIGITVTAYTLLGFFLLTSAPVWLGSPWVAGALNFIGVCGSITCSVSTHKVVSDTVSPLHGARGMALGILHSMNVAAPRAVIFLLASLTKEHAFTYLVGSMLMAVLMAAVGLLRLRPFYDHTKDLAASAIDVNKFEPPAATPMERSRLSAAWTMQLCISVVVPSAMAWLRLSQVGNAVPIVPLVVASVAAVFQLSVLLSIPSVVSRLAATFSPRTHTHDFHPPDVAAVMKDPAAVAAGVAALQAGAATSSPLVVARSAGGRASYGTEMTSPGAEGSPSLLAASSPLPPEPDTWAALADATIVELRRQTGLPWVVMIVSVGLGAIVMHCLAIVEPQAPYTLGTVNDGDVFSRMPFEILKNTAVISALMPLFGIGNLIAGAVFIFIPVGDHESKQLSSILRPALVSFISLATLVVCCIILSTNLTITSLLIAVPFMSLAAGGYGSAKVAFAANMFEGSRLALTYGFAKAICGIGGFTLISLVMVPAQESRINAGNYFVVTQRRFCNGGDCYTFVFAVLAGLASFVLFLDTLSMGRLYSWLSRAMRRFREASS